MKIDFSKKPLDGYSKEFVMNGAPLTLGQICVKALDNALDGEKPVPSDIFQRGKLALQIIDWENSAAVVDSDEDIGLKQITMLKDRVARTFSKHPIMVNIVWGRLSAE